MVNAKQGHFTKYSRSFQSKQMTKPCLNCQATSQIKPEGGFMKDEVYAYLLWIAALMENSKEGVPIVAQWVKNWTSIHGGAGSIPGLDQWVKVSSITVSCGVGLRYGSDPALLWLWPAAAAPIQPLAQELPYGAGVPPPKKKKKKKTARKSTQ